MVDELIDVFDENNNPLNIQKLKSEVHKNGLWHRAAHVWIYNSSGSILLQYRAKDKQLFPNKWDISASGHVKANEDPASAALREIEEEIGLKFKKGDLELVQIRKKEINNGSVVNEFYYVFFLKYDGNEKMLKFQDKEVDDAKFLPVMQIKKDIIDDSSKYFPHGQYWFDIITEVMKRTNH